MKRQDLTTQKFGTLQPIKIVGKTKSGHMVWECKCDCGNIKNVSHSDLKTGNTTSCGFCQRSTIPKDLKNQRFGMLTVIDKADNIGEKTAWNCQCDCGKKNIVKTMNLMNGHARSCGCQINYNKVNHVGKRFGRLMVVAIAGREHSHKVYICRCDCGNECLVDGSNLSNNKTKSCGCLQLEMAAKLGSKRVGPLNHGWKGGKSRSARNCQEYRKWKLSVLKRDKFCQICGDNAQLEAHHLQSFVDNPDSRYLPENGICLCWVCHKLFHMEYGSGGNTPEQFKEFCQKWGIT